LFVCLFAVRHGVQSVKTQVENWIKQR